MSYDELDAARDEMYDLISQELYPDHKVQAIEEFTSARLCSFYVKYPSVMRPAVDALQEGKALRGMNRHSAALVFYVSSIELLLKSTLLRPVVYGLVHNEGLAEIVVQHALGQTGFERYEGLLSDLFLRLAGVNLKQIKREDASENLLQESKKLQKLRNEIIHKGLICKEFESEVAHHVAVAVYELIVRPMLYALGLTIVENGAIMRSSTPPHPSNG